MLITIHQSFFYQPKKKTKKKTFLSFLFAFPKATQKKSFFVLSQMKCFMFECMRSNAHLATINIYIFLSSIGPYKHSHLASHLHTELCICLLNITIEEIKSQLCPLLVILSHKQGEREKNDVSKKEGKRERSSTNNEYKSNSSTTEECFEEFNYRIYLFKKKRESQNHIRRKANHRC